MANDDQGRQLKRREVDSRLEVSVLLTVSIWFWTSRVMHFFFCLWMLFERRSMRHTRNYDIPILLKVRVDNLPSNYTITYILHVGRVGEHLSFSVDDIRKEQ